MTLHYTVIEKVEILIHENIEKMLMKLPLEMTETSKTPAAFHLFNVNSQAKKLLKEKCSAISPSGSKTSVPMQTYMTQYPNAG